MRDLLSEIVAEVRKTGEVLCPFVALLTSVQPTRNSIVEDDDFPPETMIGEIPGWALDVYSREGRAAYARFLQTGSASARWIRGHVSPGRQVGLLGHVVFRLEGGLVRNRLRWKLADELRRQVDVDCAGLSSRDATEIFDLVKSDTPILNGVRAKLNGEPRHV